MKPIRYFWRLAPDAAARGARDASFLEDVLNGDEEGILEVFDVDRAWDAIHFLISANRAYPDQEEDADALALDHSVLGGKLHKGVNRGSGPAGVVLPAEVKRIAELLDGLSQEEMKERFDPEAMDTAEVYPEIWKQEAEAAWEYVWDYYLRFKEFYLRTAKEGSGVATMISPPPEE